MKSQEGVIVFDHPLIQQKLTQARDRHTDRREFRDLLAEIAALMVFELTRDYESETLEVRTPVGMCTGSCLAAEVTLVPILRAGLGMIESILHLVPQARVGHLGIYRDEETLLPVAYYDKLPSDIANSEVIVIDPMLATGGSCSHAVTVIKGHGARRIKALCLVAAPEGIHRMRTDHPEAPIYTAAIDEGLNEHGFIVPGLGDAGDRLFGTG